jgi:hypothetical protein
MQDLTPILRRVGQLCASLESDAELRGEIESAGFAHWDWDHLADAIRTGSPHALTALLDAIEEAAVAAGLDGITYPTREFRPLPNGLPEFRAVSGWRCPHPHRCGRVYSATDSTATHICAVTGDVLTRISVDSG